MFSYKVTFLGGSSITVHATSPREAWEKAGKTYQLEVINIRFLK